MDALPDPEKATFRFRRGEDRLRITLFRERVRDFSWATYLRIVEPDDTGLRDRVGHWGNEFLERFQVQAIRDGEKAKPVRTFVGYDRTKVAAIYFVAADGGREEVQAALAAETLASLRVDSGERDAWFRGVDEHAWTAEETFRRNKRKSREALALRGWPVPEAPDGSWRETRWEGHELVFRTRVTSVPPRAADWIHSRLVWRGFGEGVVFEDANVVLQWRLDLRTGAWDDLVERKYRRRKEVIENRIRLLTPLYEVSRHRSGTAPPPYPDVQQVWPFEGEWARFTRGIQIPRDSGPRGTEWTEFQGTYHAMRRDGLLLEDAFPSMEELEATLRELSESRTAV